MAAPIYNPVVPCVHPVPGGMYPGRMIRVQGNIPPGAQRFAINFQCGPNTDPRDDIAMHLNFRFVEMCVVRNHLTAMDWGVEDTAGGMPLQRGEAFEALILCEPQSFKVALNGVHFCEFLHRVPFQRITHLTVDGDVHIQFIGFEGAQPPPQQMYMVNQYQQPQAYRSEPPAYGAYGAPPPAYGAPGYGAPQGFASGGAVPVGYQTTTYGAPQQRGGIGTGAAVGMGVGALAAGGLAGYALGGGFSSHDSPPTEVGFQESEIPTSTFEENRTDILIEENRQTDLPTEDDDYLENTDNQNDVEQGQNDPVDPEEEIAREDDDYLENTDNQENEGQEENETPQEENNEEEAPADDDYLENENQDEVDEAENEIPAYTEEENQGDDDYMENDE